MGKEAIALRSSGSVLVAAENDVIADGEGMCADRFAEPAARSVRVDTYGGEIVTEPRLHQRANPCVEHLPGQMRGRCCDGARQAVETAGPARGTVAGERADDAAAAAASDVGHRRRAAAPCWSSDALRYRDHEPASHSLVSSGATAGVPFEDEV